MNRTELRASTYSRLQDPSTGGLYSTAQVDAALDDAHDLIAPAFPIDRTLAKTVATGQATVTEAATPLDNTTRIFLPTGRQIPRIDEPAVIDTSPHAPLSWTTYADTIRLSRPVQAIEAGSWQIDYWTLSTPPTTDTTAWDLPDTLAGALTALAAAELIRSRISADARRGHRIDYATRTLAEDLTSEARAIIAAHKRRARGSSML